MIYIVKNKYDNPKAIKRAIELIRDAGGIEYATQKMIALKNEALALLNEIPESPAKKALIGLVEYSIERKK